MIPGSWTLVTLQALLDEPRGLLKHVVGSEILGTPFSLTDVVRSSAKPLKFWTAVMRGLLAQNEMSESLSLILFRFLPLVMWILSDDQV